ncbi:MAG: NAD(P)-dependent oxidoreductase, partial [Actinomycetota bacterium]
MSNTARNVGYIGLGNLGFHLAHSLLRSGHRVTITDLDRSLAEPLIAKGAIWADSAREVAEQSDVVFTCLPSPRAVDAVVAGPNGVFEGLRAGGTWIDNSTNDQHETMRFAELAAARGIHVLEAPVTGGVHKAAAGEITVLVGGDEAIFQANEELLAAIGSPVLY